MRQILGVVVGASILDVTMGDPGGIQLMFSNGHTVRFYGLAAGDAVGLGIDLDE